MATATAPLLVEPSTSEFWVSVGIFPDALQHTDKLDELKRKARKSLLDLGLGNLRLLCEQAKVPRPPDGDQEALAKLLMGSAPSHTLLHLREFMHRRVAAIEETFASHFTDAQRAGFEGDLASLCKAPEQMKAFTKLVLLYRQNPDRLRDTYYLKLARSKPTYHEFELDGKLPPDAAGRIEAKAGRLEYELQQLTKNRPVRFQGCHTLPNKTVVVSVLRQYSPTVRPDFRPDTIYNMHFGYGHVVFSIHPIRQRVDVRCQCGRTAETIQDWLGGVLGIKLRPVKRSVFSTYDAEQVVRRVLGEYPGGPGVEVTGVRFRRSALPGQSPLTLEAGPHQPSIREDLHALRETGTVHLRSLTDLDHLVLSYQGQTARVVVESGRGGLARLCFDNTDWEYDREQAFREAFEKTFLLPLDRPIDPTKLAMGQEGIFGYLLGVKLAHHVQPFQRNAFDKLAQWGILARKPERVHECPKTGCEQKPIPDTSVQECPRCGTRLTAQTLERVSRSARAIKQFLAGVLSWAGCDLGDEENQFEGVKYSPLRFTDPAGQKRITAVLIRDAVPDSVKTKLERSSRALLFVKARTPDRPVYLDDSGVGQISLAYLLAARDAAGGIDEARAKCRDLLDNLHRDHARRVLQSGQRSYLSVRDSLGTTRDYEFETDVFNILRALFPETIKLGRQGKTEPDGFCGLPVFDGDLRDGRLWTWTYDAKLAESGKPYNLDSGEYRKIRDYVEKFRRANTLFSRSKRLRAHVLISNNIDPARMKVAADYLRGPEGIRPENHDVKLVLMEHTFVLRLYERVRDRDEAFRRRGPFLAEEVAAAVGRECDDGYTHLKESDANIVADTVLARDEVYPAVEELRLLHSIDKPS